MSSHRIRYEGPSSLALATATLVADAGGVDLTSSDAPVRSDGARRAIGPMDTVVLMFTVDGTDEAVQSAVGRLRAGLPSGARLDLD